MSDTEEEVIRHVVHGIPFLSRRHLGWHGADHQSCCRELGASCFWVHALGLTLCPAFDLRNRGQRVSKVVIRMREISMRGAINKVGSSERAVVEVCRIPSRRVQKVTSQAPSGPDSYDTDPCHLPCRKVYEVSSVCF